MDHARAKVANKHGGPDARRAAALLDSLPDPNSAEQAAGFLLLDRDRALAEPRTPGPPPWCNLRYFAGLSVEDTAAALGVSEPTVKRTRVFGRAWLRDAIDRDCE